MYVGRLLVVAPNYAAYRVSSRSYPDRVIRERDGGLDVVPEDDYDNPYVSYTCLRPAGGGHVVGNGSHVDPVAEKIDLGYPARDALALSLLAMDYEKDDYDTPRIAGYVGEESFVATVRRDGLSVEAVEQPVLVATYERDRPDAFDFDASSAEEAARRAYDLEFEHAVAACAVYDGETAVYNG
ncbi:MAG: IMP cyclohydrolase [Halobacteriota archaeon]